MIITTRGWLAILALIIVVTAASAVILRHYDYYKVDPIACQQVISASGDMYLENCHDSVGVDR